MKSSIKILHESINDNSIFDSFYNIILTFILAFAIIWIIYILIPYEHYCLYLT